MKVEIVGFENSSYQVAATGIKGHHYYANEPVLGGYYSYGSFKSYPIAQCFVKWRNPKNGRIESQDIRSWLKDTTDNRRLTQSYLQELTEANKGNFVDAHWSQTDNTRVLSDLRQLIII